MADDFFLCVLIFYVNKESKLIFDSFVLIFYGNKWGFPNKPQVLKAKDYQ